MLSRPDAAASGSALMLLRAGRGKSLTIAENPGKDRVTNTAPGVRGGGDFVDFVPETDVKTLQK